MRKKQRLRISSSLALYRTQISGTSSGPSCLSQDCLMICFEEIAQTFACASAFAQKILSYVCTHLHGSCSLSNLLLCIGGFQENCHVCHCTTCCMLPVQNTRRWQQEPEQDSGSVCQGFGTWDRTSRVRDSRPDGQSTYANARIIASPGRPLWTHDISGHM